MAFGKEAIHFSQAVPGVFFCAPGNLSPGDAATSNRISHCDLRSPPAKSTISQQAVLQFRGLNSTLLITNLWRL
ncbi:hypothetical protein Pan44_01450 [Caulifigura coniformis]|uniref:Uncharacterized protein n=1 Tax=Caulifigura coniformis TaxID=2527983 RepID=A0A517S7N6_9PLAN|nr:hypothetical protein [Caulifigura coniformis]QDT52136.1 hypothetical protein Pan44_01450 [Caulifigura coniformis]